MAFDELGKDSSRPTQDYTLSATGLVSRTFGVWSRQLVQYIIIIGITGAITLVVAFLVLFFIFGTITVVGSDPISYFFTLFTYGSFLDLTLIAFSLLLVIVSFIIYAIIGGATTKYALDDYDSHNGDIARSFSHSLSKALNFMVVQLVISCFTFVPLYPGMIIFTNVLLSIDISDPFNPIFPPGTMEAMMTGAILLFVGLPFVIYLSARFAPTVAIVMDTDFSVVGSLKKSWELTDGNVLHVIAGRLLFGIAVIIISTLIGVFTVFLGQYSVVIESTVITLLFGALNYIFPVVLYRDLSSRVKSSSLEELLL